MSTLQFLASDNFITVNRTVASIVGLEAAAVLGELASEALYWQKNNPDGDGWFFSTVENLEKRVFLSAHQQRQAIQQLEEQGWIETEKKGMPARRFIRIKEAEIIRSLNDQSLKNLTTSDKKNERPVVKNFDGKKNINKKIIEKEKREERQTARDEMRELLHFASGAYPNARIKDEEATIDAWMATLSQYSWDDLFEAIKLHIGTNKFFPNPSEISDKIIKASLTNRKPKNTILQEHHPEENDKDIDDLINFIYID